jgi:hypothetical protein
MPMRNENGHESTLDRAIDHVVHQMMQVDPRPDLRQRVLGRLNDPPRGNQWIGFGVLATAAALVLVFATMIDPSSETQPASPGPVAVQSSATPGVPPQGPQTADDKPATLASPPIETARRPEPSPESIFGPRTDRVRGATVTAPLQGQGATGKPGGKDAAAQAPAQLANLKLEVTISDDREGVATPPKTVSLVTADRQWGRSRSTGPHAVLNVDARMEILNDGRIRVQMTLEYRPSAQPAEKQPLSSTTKTISAIVDEGKALSVSESADPASNRTVKVEIRVTRLT